MTLFIKTLVASIVCAIFFSTQGIATTNSNQNDFSWHSGGTDKNGCHHDRKKGGYHCHNPK